MATATKASLQSELLAAQAELFALREQHESLQSKLEGAELIQTLWLCDLLDGQGERSNPATGTRSFRFAAQKSRRDKRTGKYNRGPKRTFIAYGPIVDQLAEIYASDDRRVAITAFESPWSDGSGRSDWTVTSLQVQQRPEQPATTTHQEVIDPELF